MNALNLYANHNAFKVILVLNDSLKNSSQNYHICRKTSTVLQRGSSYENKLYESGVMNFQRCVEAKWRALVPYCEMHCCQSKTKLSTTAWDSLNLAAKAMILTLKAQELASTCDYSTEREDDVTLLS